MSKERVWYVYYKNETYGPYETSKIIALLKEGALRYSDYIFKEGFKDWEYIYNVPDFDRRLLNPGGSQPVIETPQDKVPDPSKIKSLDKKTGEELWFIHDGTSQTGPFTTSHVKEGLEKKKLFWTYYIWREGFKDWVQIKECKEFDRRRNVRSQVPKNIKITKNIDELKEKSAVKLPDSKVNNNLSEEDKLILQQNSYKYDLEDLDQEELKDKYPYKSIIYVFVFTLFVFGAISSYPLILKYYKEKKASEKYEMAVKEINQGNEEIGYKELFNVIDMYPYSKTKIKAESFLMTREPIIKSCIADEAREINSLINGFVKRYGVLPMNAVDINYSAPFCLKNFGEFYYKQNIDGTIEVFAIGNKIPISGYMFSVKNNSLEEERFIDLNNLEYISSSYIKLRYKGKRTKVKPVIKFQAKEKKPLKKVKNIFGGFRKKKEKEEKNINKELEEKPLEQEEDAMYEEEMLTEEEFQELSPIEQERYIKRAQEQFVDDELEEESFYDEDFEDRQGEEDIDEQ
jgi:hypothetical protein